jgi:hypothetical protein
VIETVDEFRFAARCLRDLYSGWRMLKDGHDAIDYDWVSPKDPNLFTSIYQPASLLSGGGLMAAFLSYFTPQVGLLWTYKGPASVEDLFRPAETTTIEVVRQPSGIPLHAGLALELFNHIVDNVEYHICANDRCQQTFVHQQGRSAKGQRRTRGVLYHSPECARATAQRESGDSVLARPRRLGGGERRHGRGSRRFAALHAWTRR